MISAMTEIPPIDVTGKTTLKQLAYLIKKAKVFVGGDTGPMHLAVAVDTPTIALMGPTDIRRNGPIGNGHIPLVVARDCAGCWDRKCSKGLDFLAIISPDEVYISLKKLMGRSTV